MTWLADSVPEHENEACSSSDLSLVNKLDFHQHSIADISQLTLPSLSGAPSDCVRVEVSSPLLRVKASC